MVGSFIILVIVGLLRLTAGTLTGKFSWLGKVIPYLNYGCYGALGLFGLFVFIALFKAIFSGGRKSRR